MTKISEVIHFLEQIAPPALQENYDNAGLLVGDAQQTVTGVLCSLDVTETVVDEAISKGFNLIVAHHPIIFGGLKRLTGRNYIEKTVIKAIKNDIAIYVAHTNLDNVAFNGVNTKIGEKLGLENGRVLRTKEKTCKKLYTYVPLSHLDAVRNSLFAAGAGKIGHYDECGFVTEGLGSFRAGAGANPFVGEVGERHYEKEAKLEVIFNSWEERSIIKALKNAHPYEEIAYEIVALDNHNPYIGSGWIGTLPEKIDSGDFLPILKQKMQATVIRHTALCKKTIQTVAVCGGAGGFLLNDAIAAGADIFITSDYKYHEFFDANGRIIIADIGHYETEQFTIELFFDLICKNFTTFAAAKISISSNPVFYA